MIISNSKGYVFVHIPKTAGTAVTRALASDIQWNDVVLEGNPGDARYRQRFGLWKHARAAEIQAATSDQLWNDSFTFSFVRNPYERMRSLYTYTKQYVRSHGARRHLARIGRIRGNTPPYSWGWVRAYLESRDFSSYIRHPLLFKDHVALPMSDYLMDEGSLLVDYVGRFESLDSDFGLVCERLGLSTLPPDRHNASKPSAPLGEYYASDADYDLVYENYRQDFEKFGYQRSPAQSRVVDVSLDTRPGSEIIETPTSRARTKA